MKAIFLLTAIIMIGAPFLIQSVNASPMPHGLECNHGGMTNDTGGPSCVDSGNKTAANFDPWFNITHTKPGVGQGRVNLSIPDNNTQFLPGSEIMPPGLCVDNRTDCGQ
jgi:hypothetical protein